VVHLVSPGDLALMNATAGDYAPDVSEIDALQIATVPALKVQPPRLAHSLVSFECECVSVRAYPAEAPACDLILAKVLCLHIDDSLLNSEGRIRHDQIDWLARLGGQWYCHSQHDDNLTLARPNRATPRR
jgi:flavin reductase (DIM6/NTAB) family NADH-FMN oxidoreductase RutF